MVMFAFAMAPDASAQQALWSGAKVVSPQINEDNTVTFRYSGPNVIRVQVTGDFLPPQKISTPNGEFEVPGIAELTQNQNGVWTSNSPFGVLIFCGGRKSPVTWTLITFGPEYLKVTMLSSLI